MSNEKQGNLSDVAMEKELLDIWRRALKNNILTIDDDFFECGGDSLLATQVLLEIEKLTGKSLTISIIFETGTIRQLLKKVSVQDEIKPQIYALLGSADGKIIHYFYADLEYGRVNVKTFSKLLGDGYLVHTIAPHIAHEGEFPDSIDGMAKERLSKIIEVQPEGPYIILGSCTGALVGFEAARQLILMGKEVKAVVMLNPVIMSIRRSAQFIFTIAGFLMRLVGVHEIKRRQNMRLIWNLLVFLDAQTKDIWRRTLLFLLKSWPEKRTVLEKLLQLIGRLCHIQKFIHEAKKSEIARVHYLNALFSYKPLPLNVPVLYISTSFSGYAWRRIARNTVYINVCGGKHTSWGENYSLDLVNKIKELINR